VIGEISSKLKLVPLNEGRHRLDVPAIALAVKENLTD
jgi:hypothetical protein